MSKQMEGSDNAENKYWFLEQHAPIQSGPFEERPCIFEQDNN